MGRAPSRAAFDFAFEFDLWFFKQRKSKASDSQTHTRELNAGRRSCRPGLLYRGGLALRLRLLLGL